MVLSLGSSGRRKNNLALICLVWKWKMPLDHLWLNVEFHTRMCGKDSSVPQGGKKERVAAVGRPLLERALPTVMAAELRAMLFCWRCPPAYFFLPFSSFWPLPEAFAPVWPLGPSIRNYLLLSCLFTALRAITDFLFLWRSVCFSVKSYPLSTGCSMTEISQALGDLSSEYQCLHHKIILFPFSISPPVSEKPLSPTFPPPPQFLGSRFQLLFYLGISFDLPWEAELYLNSPI